LRYLFGDHTLDTDRRELRRGANIVPVTPQVFDILEFLIRNRERVVSKDDFIATIWGGRIVSDAARTTRLNAARRAIGDSGEAQSVIRTVARKGLRFVAEVREVEQSEDTGTATVVPEPGRHEVMTRPILVLPDKPSIAVLPFANLSGDTEQEYFVGGVVEDITTALSRMRWLFVIARGSSLTYKGRVVDVRQVGRELGVRYVLQGSVRKGASRARISAQLIDASTGVHLWSGRFEGVLDDIFDLQDRVTASVVGAIAPELQQAEIQRARRKPTKSLDAYDYFLRGISREGLAEGLEQRTSEGNSEALRLFRCAIALDPDFAAAYGMAALCYAQRKAFGWMSDRVREIGEAERLARQGIQAGRDDAVSLGTSGYVLAFVVHELDTGAAMIEQALALNPNFAAAWLFSGWTKVWLGRPDVAIEHLERAVRLSPLGRGIAGMQAATAHAHFFAGRHEEASSWAERVFREYPASHPGLRIAAASNAAAGRIEQAKKAVARLRQLDPALRVSNLKEALGPYRPDDLAHYEEGMRKAGLPE
jgi:TolB-like protein/Tfp pilus assembly protein PilF